ncbi:MAG: ABC transporter ATP-binding protein [Clostridia bacterium]|nr:ABC transporter ATP-binding protein [Clostridia bacterium]
MANAKERKAKKKKSYNNLFKILGYGFKKEKTKLIIFTLLNVVGVVLALIEPKVQQQVYNSLYASAFDRFFRYFLYFAVVCAFGDILFRTQTIVVNYASNSIQVAIVERAIHALFPIASSTLDSLNTGKLHNRVVRDPVSLDSLYPELVDRLSSVLRSVGYVVIIYTFSWQLAILTTVGSIISYLIQRWRLKTYQKFRKQLNDIYDKNAGFVREGISGIRDVKVLDMQQTIEERVKNYYIDEKKIKNLRAKKVAIIDYISIAFYLIRSTAFALLAWQLLKHELIDVPTLIIFWNYQYSVTAFVRGIVSLQDYMNEKELVAERVLELYNEDIYPHEKYGTTHLDNVVGRFEIKDLDFEYKPDEPLFEKLNITFEENKLTAIVGKSGEGKSTISSVLFHLYDWQSGSVMLDGVDVRQLDKDTLKNNVSIVLQQPYIFNMSIKDNLLLAKKDATEEDLWRVLEKSQLKDYIESLPNKLDSLVGENGIQMSGGQKQRLSIARALLKNTKVIIFDEATSSLDNESQSKIQKVMKDLKGEHTLIVIAHRLSTIKDADKIVVLSNHTVCSEGTHDELMKKSEPYRALYVEENID